MWSVASGIWSELKPFLLIRNKNHITRVIDQLCPLYGVHTLLLKLSLYTTVKLVLKKTEADGQN